MNICPKCNKNPKVEGQSYCKQCRNEYSKAYAKQSRSEKDSLEKLRRSYEINQEANEHRLNYLEEKIFKLLKRLNMDIK